jgi:RNA polymerase sigma-70 factor (ECF subfamily)
MSQDPSIDPDRWVDDHGDALYGYAFLRLRDADLAAELVQDTFLEGLKSLDKFQGRSSERTWLFGILKHKIIDRFRQRSRREQALGGDDRAEGDLGEFFDERGSWKVRIEIPEASFERAEFWEVFRACLAELPVNYAEAFTLSELEGLTGPEVCKILEITPANLWARLHRARLLLRKSLQARWFEPGDRPG